MLYVSNIPGAFVQYNTNYTYTFFNINPKRKSAFIMLKINGGLGGIGVDSNMVSLSGGAYSDIFWFFTYLNSGALGMNGLLKYRNFLFGGYFKVFSVYGELKPHIRFLGGYEMGGYDLSLTFDTLFGVLLGFKWKFVGAYGYIRVSGKPSISFGVSAILEPEYMKRDTVVVESPVYIQVPIIVQETVYVKEHRREELSKKGDTIKSPKVSEEVIENLYLKGLNAYSKGKYAEALFFFEEILRLDPGNRKAMRAVERLRKILEGQ